MGIDAHKKTLAVAVLAAGAVKPEEFTVDNDERSIRKLVRRLDRDARGREVRICYEAGTCGYTLQRRLEASGKVVCEVIAPSLIPVKPGERIKTDKRDARKLAELYRAGVLTTVSPPSPEQEAIRDLCRCREDVRADLGRCRHRLVKMLVRRGFVFNSTSRLWSEAHRRWLKAVVFDNEIDRTVMAEYMLAIDQTERRLRAMDDEIAKAAQLPIYREHVAWLRCFRGIDTTIAMIFVAEMHGLERFESPRALAAYLGLVPSLYSSGESATRGGITKTGNGHIRRALIQAAWQYRHRAAIGPKLRARQQGQPARVVTIADQAQRRLTGRYQRLTARGKMPTKVVVAIARELVGFLWAALRDDREAARHGARSSAQVEGAKASAAPRSSTCAKIKPPSKTEVGQRREARKEKRAV
ncbi:MAG: IS110 family transposase [Burkholderiales bacterium]|nr:IS110 family transposase [Burkholderiales bacterium]